MSHYNKKCPIDIENYGAIGPSTLSSFLITAGYNSSERSEISFMNNNLFQVFRSL